MSGSALFAQAIAMHHTVRAEYELLLEVSFERAERDCNAVLLNASGRAAGIDPRSLFMGPAVRVKCYASPELVEWFEVNGRTTYADFERDWVAGLWEERATAVA